MAEFALMEREQRVDGSPEPYAKSVLNLPLYYCALLAIYAFTKNKIEVLESMAALTAIVWVAYMVVGLIVVVMTEKRYMYAAFWRFLFVNAVLGMFAFAD